MVEKRLVQLLAVLFRRPLPIGELRALVERAHEIGAESPGGDGWRIAGPTLAIHYQEELGGFVLLDTVDHPWPDRIELGDRETRGAWAAGCFGAFGRPGGLQAAVRNASRTCDDSGAAAAAHAGFVRIQLGYAEEKEGQEAPAAPDAEPPAVRAMGGPDERDRAHELAFMTELARALLDHPDALYVFSPGSELLMDRAFLDPRIERGRTDPVLALDAWCGVRLFPLAEGWGVMDTVGNAQVGALDLEVAYPLDAFDNDDMRVFLLRLTRDWLVDVIDAQPGEVCEGPGGIPWQVASRGWSLADPVRPAARLVPAWPEGHPGRRPVPPDPAPPAASPGGRAPWWRRLLGRG